MAQMLFHELRPFLAEAQAADVPVTLGQPSTHKSSCSPSDTKPTFMTISADTDCQICPRTPLKEAYVSFYIKSSDAKRRCLLQAGTAWAGRLRC